MTAMRGKTDRDWAADDTPIGELVDGFDLVRTQRIPYGRLPGRARTVYSGEFTYWSDVAAEAVASLIDRPKGGRYRCPWATSQRPPCGQPSRSTRKAMRPRRFNGAGRPGMSCAPSCTPRKLIPANPMPLVGRPKLAKTLPKALPTDSVTALLATLHSDSVPRRRSDWIERDRALILTGLLAGLRADELLRANVGDLRRTDDGAVVHVRGKGGRDRRVPIEAALVEVIEDYLDSRSTRFPATAKQRSSPGRGLAAPGRRRRRCLWVPMETASPAASCNNASCAPSVAPASMPTAHAAHLSTAYVRHRTRQFRRQRLMKLLGTRVHRDRTALRHRGRPPKPAPPQHRTGSTGF